MHGPCVKRWLLEQRDAKSKCFSNKHPDVPVSGRVRTANSQPKCTYEPYRRLEVWWIENVTLDIHSEKPDNATLQF